MRFGKLFGLRATVVMQQVSVAVGGGRLTLPAGPVKSVSGVAVWLVTMFRVSVM